LLRKCHEGACPFGIGTQDPELRRRFAGRPEYLERFMYFVAEEVRQIMAELGFKKFEEIVGRVDRLKMRQAIENWKAKGLDFSNIFYQPRSFSVRSPKDNNKILLNLLKPTDNTL